MNVLASLYGQGADDAFDRRQRYAQERARLRSGRAMASGDAKGAAVVMYDAGMLDAGAAIESRQQAQEDRQLGLEKDRQGLERQAKADAAQALLKVSTALQHVPAGQRLATLERVKPALAGVINVGVLDGLTEADLTDDNLRMFGAEMDNSIKILNTSGGVVAVDPSALARDINDPNAHRVIYQDPYYAQRQEAQIDATRARAGASNASAEAARERAARSRRTPVGGGRGGGGKPKSYGEDEVSW